MMWSIAYGRQISAANKSNLIVWALILLISFSMIRDRGATANCSKTLQNELVRNIQTEISLLLLSLLLLVI